MHESVKKEEAVIQSTVTQEKSASAPLHEDTFEPSYQSLKEQLAATQDQLEKCLAESRRYQEQITYLKKKMPINSHLRNS
ncbi:hypothetical protein [Rickettsiella massiliensis]|uniref:hypothetical protein n=1 Tax=Rickettsiella massiliensis TaxID=676517 RepID=UPI0012EAB3E2|nr:hypothetical protein [Rickettsiella massiliensis]